MRKLKILPGMMDSFRLWKNPAPWFMRQGMEGLRALFKVVNLPVIRRFHPWTQASKTNMYWIPVNKELVKDDSIPLPYAVVERFIEESSTRVVMDFCGCRKAYGCEHFPTDVGCLMMGDDAKKIPPQLSRQVSKEEARAHLQKAVDAGLPPFIGKARIDNFIFGVPDNGKLLTVCFCCSCCCITDILAQIPHHEREQIIHPLESLTIEVAPDECMGCGQCLEDCVLGAIAMEDGTAVISEECRGCGRCVSSCPQNAIKISLDNPDFVEQAVANIRKYVQA
ncbi:MAG: 4Fe-4S binding protein [Pseudomonadota bacterium]